MHTNTLLWKVSRHLWQQLQRMLDIRLTKAVQQKTLEFLLLTSWGSLSVCSGTTEAVLVYEWNLTAKKSYYSLYWHQVLSHRKEKPFSPASRGWETILARMPLWQMCECQLYYSCFAGLPADQALELSPAGILQHFTLPSYFIAALSASSEAQHPPNMFASMKIDAGL